MDKWYISINSKARGPYSDGQIRERIQTGELVSDTLIYREGDLDWLPLRQQNLWSPMLKEDEGHSFIPSKDSKVWVLLVENPLKQGDFRQQGPFNQSDVIKKYDTGELQESDYVWRPGMKNWSKIKEMPELVLTRKRATRFEPLKVKEVYAADLDASFKTSLLKPLKLLKFLKKKNLIHSLMFLYFLNLTVTARKRLKSQVLSRFVLLLFGELLFEELLFEELLFKELLEELLFEELLFEELLFEELLFRKEIYLTLLISHRLLKSLTTRKRLKYFYLLWLYPFLWGLVLGFLNLRCLLCLKTLRKLYTVIFHQLTRPVI